MAPPKAFGVAGAPNACSSRTTSIQEMIVSCRKSDVAWRSSQKTSAGEPDATDDLSTASSFTVGKLLKSTTLVHTCRFR
jgi:hypothetical protein